MAALLGGVGLASAPMVAQATPSFTLTRLAGPTRVETAVEISKDTFDTAAAALIVNRDAFPDALAGNFLAADTGSPILLSDAGSVPQASVDELARLGATDVVLLGGTTVLADSVASQLDGLGYEVGRVAGINRFATAAAIAQSRGAADVGVNEADLKTAVVSSGFDANFPDALAAGPVVYAQNFPQLLTPPTSMATEIPAVLTALGIQHVIVTGGTTAISAGVVTALEAEGVTVERLAGGDRFGTATAVANKAIDALGHVDTHVNVAFARNFPDALAGGPHAGEELSTIVLSETATVDATTCAFLTARASTLATGNLFGGTGVVSEATKTGLEACAQAPGDSNSGQIVTEGGGEYTFVNGNGDVIDVDFNNAEDGADDTYTVDGDSVSAAVFQGELDAGDQIVTTDDDDPDTADSHALTNVTVLSGVVGNVVGNTFDIVNPVTGDIVGGPFTVVFATDTVTFDGSAAPQAAFADDVNEGDTVVVTDADDDGDPEAFAFSNETVSGTAENTTTGATATFDIAGLGTFTAGDDLPADEDFTVEGAPALFADFNGDLTDGDAVTYAREDGVETFTLENEAPPAVTGVAGTINFGTDMIEIVNEDGATTITYTGATIRRDNTVVVENDINGGDYDDLTPGDSVTYQADDAGTSTDEELTFTNADLTGLADDIVTAAGTLDVLGPDDTTALVDDLDYTTDFYGSGGEKYFVNDAEQTLAEFNDALDAVVAEGDLDDTITVTESGSFTEYRLDTDDDLTP